MSETTALKSKNSFSTREIILIAMFTSVTAVCSWLSIQFGPVEFTMQTFAIFCTVCILGGRNSLFSVLTYILLGAAGLPVFAHFSGGIGALLSNSGGYIVGFIFIPLMYIIGEKLFGNRLPVKTVCLLIGLLICYAFGTAWFMYAYGKNVESVTLVQAMKWCVLPFVPFDVLKLVLAMMLSERVKKHVRL